jgi:hypothetical protein
MKLGISIFAALSFASCAAEGAEAEKNGPSLLGRIHFEPKYFQPTANNSEGGIGFSYKIDESVVKASGGGQISENLFQKLNLDFKAEGNVAFKRNINPNDFLKTGFDLNYVYSRASVPSLGAPDSKCNRLDPQTAEECTKEARRSATGDALVINLGLIATLESDQSFEKQAKTYGGQVTTVYRPAPTSIWNQVNLLDWPFRLLRLTSNDALGTAPSPDAFPKVRLAFERVNPDKDTDRSTVLGKTEEYNRANVELALTSPIGTIQGKQAKFEWSWRYFKEIGPDDAIKAAGLDRFRYSVTSIRVDSGWRVTYVVGRLPLDRQSDKVWEIGYHFQFD